MHLSLLHRCNETAISLKAGCQLFLRYTTRTSALDLEDFEAAKARIIEVRVRLLACWPMFTGNCAHDSFLAVSAEILVPRRSGNVLLGIR